FFFQAEDGIRDLYVTGVQTCALPIFRLINSGAALPSDRESLFWLNIYEIPSTPNGSMAESQLVTVTMRTQIKVFVRPRKLPFSRSEERRVGKEWRSRWSL